MLECEKCGYNYTEHLDRYECQCGEIVQKQDQEIFYDKEISPLVKKIIEAYKNKPEYEYAMIFETSKKGDNCKSYNGKGLYQLINIASQCTEPSGFNFDKFILSLKRNNTFGQNESSGFMDQLFKDGVWRKDNTDKNK